MGRLRAGESFPVREEPQRRFVVPVRKKATTAGASAAGVRKKSKGSDSSVVAKPPPPPSRVRPKSAAAAVGSVTVEDIHALECGVCFLPLKPPIFQCKWGHVVCWMCRDELKATGKCHMCGGATDGYSRCHAMECLVDSIRFTCLNAVHGCTRKIAYYDQHYHSQTCLYMPCRCPGKTCGFVGSMDMLVNHFEAAHGWPCATMARAAATDDVDEEGEAYTFDVSLQDGFNFLLVECPTDGILYLLLLNVVRQPHGCGISVLCLHPDNDESKEMEVQCELTYSQNVHVKSSRGDGKLIKHFQESTFTVDCTDLSDGKPGPDECYPFVVPKSFLAADLDMIKVGGRIIIIG